jgi:hypothetical protein
LKKRFKLVEWKNGYKQLPAKPVWVRKERWRPDNSLTIDCLQPLRLFMIATDPDIVA